MNQVLLGAFIIVVIFALFFLWIWKQKPERPCDRCPTSREEALLSVSAAGD